MGGSRDLPVRYARFFRALGQRIRSQRTERGLSQEAMFFYGFGVRHWQMIEAGRPITVYTLLRVCEACQIAPEQLVAGLGNTLKIAKNSKAHRRAPAT